MNKILCIAFAFAVTGCASTGDRVKSQADNSYKLAKNGSGIIYGVVGYEEATVKEACNAIKNSDARCTEQNKYKARIISPGIGFSAGVAATTALIPKEFEIKSCNRPAWEKCDYVKVKSEQGKLATVLEIVTDKCEWSGFNGAGGVVCPSLNWDYRKDLRPWDTVGGRVSVGE